MGIDRLAQISRAAEYHNWSNSWNVDIASVKMF